MTYEEKAAYYDIGDEEAIPHIASATAYRIGDDAGSGDEGGTIIDAASPEAALDWIERWVKENNNGEYRPTLWARRLTDAEYFEREMDQ